MVYAYSIGSSQRPKEEQSLNPGPGAYSPASRSKQSSPRWKIGTQPRQVWEGNLNPGPGTYNGDECLDSKKAKSPGYLFGIKTSYKGTINDGPGPGAYDGQQLIGSAPAFSISGKNNQDPVINQDSKARDTPGPGFYEAVNISAIGNRAIKIGTALRDQFYNKTNTPGPQKYSSMSPLPKVSSPQYSFGFTERMNNNNNNNLNSSGGNNYIKTVGPGTYDIRSTFRLDIGSSIGAKRNDLASELHADQPGPGAYDIQLDGVKKCAASFKIGKQQRSQSPRNHVPGPGAYTGEHVNLQTMSPMFSIGKSTRQDFSSRSNTPGPAAYSSTSYALTRSPQFSILSRHENKPLEASKASTPGPNQYKIQIDLTKERSLTYKIGSSHRDFIPIDRNPGPGAYLVKPESAKMYSFGKEIRNKKIKQDIPGPGQYNHKTFVEDFPSFVLPKQGQHQ